MSFSEPSSSRSTTIMWVVGIIALMVLPIVAIYLLVGGEMLGEEFSPDDFSRRRFSYNRMPIFQVPIRGIQHHNSASAFEQSFVADGLITAATGEKRWHLVFDMGTSNDSPDFDASILTSLLTEKNIEGDNVWGIWNDEHPKLAKIFWPEVAKLARNYLYWATPDIMHAARNVSRDDDPQFKEYLYKKTAEAFFDQAEVIRDSGDHQQAIEFYTIAIETHPTKNAYLGRSQSFLELGETEKSKKDVVASALDATE